MTDIRAATIAYLVAAQTQNVSEFIERFFTQRDHGQKLSGGRNAA
jgi:hypothetical protein